MKATRSRMWIALTVVALLVSVTLAGMTGTEAIKARNETMGKIGDAMGMLGAIAKKQAPFDAEVVQAQAKTIAEQLNKSAKLFPEGSDKGEVETWALAKIWSDREGFDKSLETAVKAAVEMQSVTEEAAFAPALGALGGGCKGCHQTYRRPR